MYFRRTKDAAEIRRIATHPRIWPTMADDLTSSPDEWNPVIHDGIWYVLALTGPHANPDIRGMFVFFPENSVAWQVHLCLYPKAWGSAAIALKQVFRWLWARTDCQRISGSVPVWNAPAIHCALRAGMKPFGVNEHSSLKNSRLHHQLLLGISRPAEEEAA